MQSNRPSDSAVSMSLVSLYNDKLSLHKNEEARERRRIRCNLEVRQVCMHRCYASVKALGIQNANDIMVNDNPDHCDQQLAQALHYVTRHQHIVNLYRGGW